VKYYIRGLLNYANFRGRAGRAEFFWYVFYYALSAFVIGVLSMAAAYVVGASDKTAESFADGVGGIFLLLTFLPSCAVAVRRRFSVALRPRCLEFL